MIDFYYKGLNYPRTTVSELIKYATNRNFRLRFIMIEPPHYNKKSTKYLNKVKDFWKIIKKNYPEVSSERSVKRNVSYSFRKKLNVWLHFKYN